MQVALLLARLLLVLVFLAAGLAKLADRAGSRQAIADFGLPRKLAAPLGLLLPIVELAVAVALLATTSAWWGGIGALGLLLLFALGIGVNLARGRTPDCHCFGQLHSEPVGAPTLVRNALLALVAAFVVSQGPDNTGPSVFGWLGTLTATEQVAAAVAIVGLGLLAAQWWFLLHLLGQNGRLLTRLENLERAAAAAGPLSVNGAQGGPTGLPVGIAAPDFALSGLEGETVTFSELRAAGKPIVLIFSDPHCAPCSALLPDIGRWQREYGKQVTIALVTRGSAEENRMKTAEHGVTHVLVQSDREVMQAYQVPGTPAALLIRADGAIGSSVALGEDAIRTLMARAAGLPESPLIPLRAHAPARTPPSNGHHHAAPSGPQIGDPAPPFRLADLDGTTVHLADFRGSTTALLFWSMQCGFCQQLLPFLKSWESVPPEGAPKLLVVSRSSADENRAMGLRSPVALDQNGSVAQAYTVRGTPMAVLVDAEGKIASSLAAGAPQVLALLGVRSGQPQPA